MCTYQVDLPGFLQPIWESCYFHHATLLMILWSLTVGLHVHELMRVVFCFYILVGLIRLSDRAHRPPSSPGTNNLAAYWFVLSSSKSCANTMDRICSVLRDILHQERKGSMSYEGLKSAVVPPWYCLLNLQCYFYRKQSLLDVALS